MAYDQDDHQTAIDYPNGVNIAEGYDPAGDLTSITATKGSTTLESLTYSYTQGSNDRDVIQSVTDGIKGTTTSYAYDPLNRLNQATTKSGNTVTQTQSYAYDGAGNLDTNSLSQPGSSQTTTMAYNAANEICWKDGQAISSPSCSTPPAGATTYSFDPDGNETGNSAGLQLAYNARNQTTSVTPPGGQTTNLGYNTDDQADLTQSNVGTLQNNILGLSRVDSSNLDYTRNNNGQLLGERTSANGDYYYLADTLGSVIGLTDPSGNAVNTYQYDPYGNTISSSGTAANVFGYAGGFGIPGGLYHYGQRYYDPGIERWTQPDPLSQIYDPTQADRYAYAADDPVTETDSSGSRLNDMPTGPDNGVLYSGYCAPGYQVHNSSRQHQCATYTAEYYNAPDASGFQTGNSGAESGDEGRW